MWNHPFYLDLYQQIMEPNAPPEVEGSQESLRAIDPDDLHLELLEAASEASRSSGASALGDDSPVQLIGDSASGSPLEDSIKSLSARDFIGGKKNGAAMGLVNKLVDDLKVSDGVGASDALGLIAAPAKAISDSESFGDALAHDSLSIEAPPREDWMQLIRVFGAHGRASDAIRIAEKTEKDFGVLRDEDMYATLIVACGDSKDANLAEAMFDEMQFNGIVPTEHSWSALVHAHVRCGRMDSAFLLMERMAQAGAKPPLAAYTSLLVGIYENSPRDQMFEQAMEVWWNLKYSGAVPSLLSYTAMIRCCTRSREIERALGLIEEMRYVQVYYVQLIFKLYQNCMNLMVYVQARRCAP
jgi:pentatricopeptide repeat protein